MHVCINFVLQLSQWSRKDHELICDIKLSAISLRWLVVYKRYILRITKIERASLIDFSRKKDNKIHGLFQTDLFIRMLTQFVILETYKTLFL